MKENVLLNTLLEDSQIKNSGLKKEFIASILKKYNDIMIDHLLQYGSVEVGNGFYLEVIPLTDRVHVLRNTVYKNNRKYKLKLTMDDEVYTKISEYYDELKELL